MSAPITAARLQSTVATGTPPLIIASTTLVPNLSVARAALADASSSPPTILTYSFPTSGSVSTTTNVWSTFSGGSGSIQTGTLPAGTWLVSLYSTYYTSGAGGAVWLRFVDNASTNLIAITEMSNALPADFVGNFSYVFTSDGGASSQIIVQVGISSFGGTVTVSYRPANSVPTGATLAGATLRCVRLF
jgi:hypothetical protein